MNEKGFTLMELLVAILLISILLLPLLTVLHKELTSDYRIHILQLALSLAQGEMEEALDVKFMERAIKDRTREVHLGNHSFRVVRDVVDGEGKGEPPGGTDPLEIRVRVYHSHEEIPIARLITLKEEW